MSAWTVNQALAVVHAALASACLLGFLWSAFRGRPSGFLLTLALGFTSGAIVAKVLP